MSYTLTALQTVADCDLQLTMANKEKDNLTFRQASLQRQQNQYATNSIEINDELASVTAELASITAIVATLPDGEIKTDNTIKMKKLEWRKSVLMDRKNNYGSMSLLDKELDLAFVGKQLEEVDAFIAAINAYKLGL